MSTPSRESLQTQIRQHFAVQFFNDVEGKSRLGTGPPTSAASRKSADSVPQKSASRSTANMSESPWPSARSFHR
jgi:hypothetical protein